MKKCFFLDTNILINSPYSIFAFDDNLVCITEITLRELDNNKSRPGEVGANVREVIRILNDLRKKGKLHEGVRLPNDGELKVVKCHSTDFDGKNADDLIIESICDTINAYRQGVGEIKDPILVTEDMVMRFKAELVGITVQEYKTDRVVAKEEQYTGRTTLYALGSTIDRLYKDCEIDLSECFTEWAPDAKPPQNSDLTLNQFVLLVDLVNEKHTALAKYAGSGKLRLLEYTRERPYGITPKNVGQYFAQEALLAPVEKAPLVILKGPAGTSKTFYSLACGLEQVLNKDLFRRILIARPNIKFDEDIGFLKGTEEDKIAPLIRPVMDNLEILCRTDMSGNTDDKLDGVKSACFVDELFERGKIAAQAMAYMRGRSVTDTWIIIDEAQNMTPLQAFGIISRAGRGSKIILCGDPDQIDNPRLDSRSNGLVYASERMRGSPLCWQMTFDEGECVRSALALEAIERLRPKGRD